MNRQKKIYQKVKKRMQQEKAKNQAGKKPAYISKAERAALALSESEQTTIEQITEQDPK